MHSARRILTLSLFIVGCGAANGWADEGSQRGQIAIYCRPHASWPAEQPDRLARRLQDAGFAVSRLDADALASPSFVQDAAFDLLIIGDASRLPAAACKTLGGYVDGGGNLMMLGGPFLEYLTWQHDGRWMDRPALLGAIAERMRPEVLMDFEAPKLGAWSHSASNPKTTSSLGRVGPGADGSQGALRLEIVDYLGWDTFAWRPADRPFGSERTWTTFWAKGDAKTSQLSIEWRERDRSRWIAVVELTQDWKFFALPPKSFHRWHDPPVAGRGGPGDAFRPQNAELLTLGLAQSHTPAVSRRGRHRIWMDQIGTANPPPGMDDLEAALAGPGALPRIETISPPYKLYRVTNLDRLRVSPKQILAPNFEVPRVAGTMSPHPRPQGTGLDKGRRWRYVPLLECLDVDGRVCGAAASLVITGLRATDGGLLVGVPVTDPEFFAKEPVVAWLVKLTERLVDGLFLYEGGAAYYASFGDERMPVGAMVANRGRRSSSATVRATVRDSRHALVWEHAFETEVPPGGSRRLEAPCPIAAEATDPLTVTVSLQRGGREIDRLEHQVRIWRPKQNPEFVTARDGDFYLGQEKWYAHGINYYDSAP